MPENMRNILVLTQRELKNYFESPVAYVFMIVFLILVSVLSFTLVWPFYEMGQADLTHFFFWHPWVYLILVPAASMRSWSEERYTRTIELLLTLPITLTQALVAKFIAAWLFLGITLAGTCPIVYWAYNLGNPDGGTILGGYIGSFLVAGTYLSVGMLTSAFTRNQVISFVASLAICLALALIGFYPFTSMVGKWAPVWLVDSMSYISILPHFLTLGRGVVDLKDIVYFASVMIFMLTATYHVLQWRKGR
jgi:ABC-2 type transport system permease protein